MRVMVHPAVACAYISGLQRGMHRRFSIWLRPRIAATFDEHFHIKIGHRLYNH